MNMKMTVDQKIADFEHMVLKTQIEIAEILVNGCQCSNHEPMPHSEFAVLSITVSYFEMIAKFIHGRNHCKKSIDRFQVGIRLVFDGIEKLKNRSGPTPEIDTARRKTLENLLNNLYSQIRCGLYHSARVGDKIDVSYDHKYPVHIDADKDGLPIRIIINPRLLTVAIRRHFEDYVAKLRKYNTSLQIFESEFDADP